MSNSLRPHELQHARLPCPSPTPGVYSNSGPLSQWCHPSISSSVVLFSSCPQSFPASGSFPVGRFFTSGGQSIGVSASALVLPMNKTGQSVWWLSAKESACQCGRHRFNPWSGKILHADPGRFHMQQGNQAHMSQLPSLFSRAGSHSDWACVLQLRKPECPRPLLRSKRNHHNEMPSHHN